MNISEIEYNGNKYGVFIAMFKRHKIPVIIDAIDILLLKSLNCKWHCNIEGCITANIIDPIQHIKKTIKLHRIIAGAIFNEIYQLIPNNSPKKISHINRLLLDNRRENIIIGNSPLKTVKKKTRIVKLPEDSGILPDELPSYVWYSQPDNTHGERFIIKLGDICWKSSSSKKNSLRYKLEETKFFLSNLKLSRPDLFNNSLNGDVSKKGKILLESFYKIVSNCGFELNHISNYSITKKYLCRRKLVKCEEHIFQNNIIKEQTKLRKCPINQIFLQKYCYYYRSTKNRGECFIVRGHPLQKKIQNNKCWISSTSRNVLIETKYSQMIQYLDNITHLYQ